MKSTIPSSPRRDSLHSLIQDATGAPAKDFAQVENIMREEIFHSTLDWQSHEQLADAARQAFARLNEDRELYDLDQACRLAMFQKMRAESALCEHDTPANHSAVVRAEERYQAAKDRLFAQFDTNAPN